MSLDLHNQMILDEYREQLPVFKKIQEIVEAQLRQCIASNNLYVNAVESRIKSEKSLTGKLQQKGHKYNSVKDITDIVGARVITFYTDEVDKIAALADKIFEIDWANSIDKRKMLELDQFGYMSLHYICRIPKTLYEDPEHPEINDYRFELQMRTALQHVWATINHDTGYKMGVEVPWEYLRNINRIAGMLELADEQFSRIRKEIIDYRRNIQSLVASGNFDEVPLNGDTFKSFLALNPFKRLIEKIAAINQAEIYNDDLYHYISIFKKMQFKTLGDVVRLIKEYSDDAYQLALHQFASTDLDIVALSVAPQNLCIAHIVKNGGGETGLKTFFDKLFGKNNYNRERVHRVYSLCQEINIIESSSNDLSSNLLDRALKFAIDAHANTERRGKGFPYIVHPMEAVEIVASITPDQELLAAAALHDTVEDTNVTVEQIRQEFGDRVARIVKAESDNQHGVPAGSTWKERKIAALDVLRNASQEVKIVALGDKLSNMRAIARDYQKLGDKLWDRFHAPNGKADHAWRYHELAKALSSLKDTDAYKEFEYLVNKTFDLTELRIDN
ncbi:MAG: HD domain-containing protein [Bacteroidales bacterium]|nr:HD domain-containing protein [Bacteroidales bacterium]